MSISLQISLPHCLDGQCRVPAANLRSKPRSPLCWRPSDPSRCKPRCVRLPSCGASCRLDANQDMPNCCQSPYALPPLMPCRAGGSAAIMVNKFFIRINFNYVGFMLQFTRIARNVFILLLNKNSQTATTKTQQ